MPRTTMADVALYNGGRIYYLWDILLRELRNGQAASLGTACCRCRPGGLGPSRDLAENLGYWTKSWE